MEIVLIILLLLCGFSLIGLGYCVYLGRRIGKVATFKRKLLDMAYEYNYRRIPEGDFHFDTDRDAYIWFSDKWTFDRMLYSFKPLTLEAWFTEEEIKKINQ